MYIEDAYGNKVKFQNEWFENRKKVSKRRTVSKLWRYDTKHIAEIELEKEGRFNNGEPHHYSKNGIWFFEINFKHDYEIPFNKYGTFLTKHGLQLKFCNPSIDRQTIIDFLYHLFHEFVKIPHGLAKRFGGDSIKEAYRSIMYRVDEVIESIADKVISTPIEEIQFKNNQLAHHFFSPNYELTVEEKNQLRLEFQGNARSKNKREQLYAALKEMDSKGLKISIKGLERFSGIARNTVKKYIVQLKTRLLGEKIKVIYNKFGELEPVNLTTKYFKYFNGNADSRKHDIIKLYLVFKHS